MIISLTEISDNTKNISISISRSSHQRCSVKQVVLRNFRKLTGKYLCQSLFYNKVASLSPFLKRRLWHMCFPVNFAKFLRKPFLQNTSGQLLLNKATCSSYVILVKKYFHLVPPAQGAAQTDDNKITAGRRFVSKEHFFFCMKK